MASTYSTNLGIELMGTGDQSGTWGATTNTNLGTLLEQAIAGYSTQAVADSASPTVLTIANGASSTGRNAVIALTGALTLARVVEVPAKTKSYIFYNATTGGFAVTVKVTGQTGVSIPNGSKAIVYCDGTDVRNVLSNIDVAATTGNVGIGTVSQAYRLHVVGASAAGGVFTTVSNTDATSNSSAGFIGIASGTNNYFVLQQVVGGTAGLTNAGAGSLTIQTTQAQPLLFSTTATERMRIDSSGNVGIGTSTFNSVKTVVQGAQTGGAPQTSGTTQTYGLLRLQGTTFTSVLDFGTNGGNYNWIQATDSANLATNYSLVLNPNGGNVGIGTSSPANSLDVQNNLTSQIRVGYVAAGATAYYDFGRDSADGLFGFNGAQTSFVGYKWKIQGTEVVRINSSGNVGIGTSSPNAKLNVYSASTTANLMQWSSGGISDTNFITIAKSGALGTAGTPQFSLGMDYSTTYVDLCAIKFARDGGAGGNMQFFTGVNANGSEQMRIDSSGNLLVGATTALAKFAAVGGGTGTTAYLKQTTAGAYVITIDSVINGATYYLINFNAAGTQTGSIASNGTLTTYAASSDVRLKENIVDAPSAIPTLKALQVRSFDWKSGPHHKFGFIAQEVVEVDPNAVAKGPTENDMWGVDNSVLVPMLVKAIQELSAKVTALESK
jgi:hypothetical protein